MFESFDLSTLDWIMLVLSAFIIGMTKTGVAGIYYLVIPMMAWVFGGKNSTGILLPMLSMADIFAVIYYNRSANWGHLVKLVPIAFVGVIIGTLVGNAISEQVFKMLMGIIVLSGIGVMVFMERRKSKEVPDYWWFSVLTGLFAGFSTMVGNAAGSVLAVYLLSMRFPKNVYIGTTAWFFMLINLLKMPFHIFSWKTITWNSFLLDLTMIPAILVGAILGVWIVRLIPEKAYRTFLIWVTALSAILLFI